VVHGPRAPVRLYYGHFDDLARRRPPANSISISVSDPHPLPLALRSDRFVPIPAPGIQLTSLTHVEDVATLLAAIPGRAAAVGEHFNACSDRPLAFDGIVQAVADAAGREARIVHYAPAELKLAKGEGFPFRAGHFFASCDKAKRLLEWAPRHTFAGDVTDRLAEYAASGRGEREIDFSTDDTILAHCGGANCEFVHVGAGKY
jgi:nucleoside-diphosphate-sugar epimerase